MSPSTRTLSESNSKAFLQRHGLTFPAETLVHTSLEAADAARAIGFPVVMKLDGNAIAHKTERGLVRLNVSGAEAAREVGDDLLAKATPGDGEVRLLVAQQVSGCREFIAGVATDPSFGSVVMLGIGGILAEAIDDVVFRLVPLTDVDAADMVDELATQKLLGVFRGEAAVNRAALANVLLALSTAALENPNLVSVDLNPLIISSGDGRPIAVDALVEVRS